MRHFLLPFLPPAVRDPEEGRIYRLRIKADPDTHLPLEGAYWCLDPDLKTPWDDLTCFADSLESLTGGMLQHLHEHIASNCEAIEILGYADEVLYATTGQPWTYLQFIQAELPKTVQKRFFEDVEVALRAHNPKYSFFTGTKFWVNGKYIKLPRTEKMQAILSEHRFRTKEVPKYAMREIIFAMKMDHMPPCENSEELCKVWQPDYWKLIAALVDNSLRIPDHYE